MTKKFNTKSRAAEIAAQLKAAEEAQKAYDDAIAEAEKHAGRARVEFVERLYDHFGIEAETTVRKDKNGQPVRDKDGEPIRVKTDKNEEKRIENLAEAFEQLVDAAEKGTSVGKAEAPAKPTAIHGEGVHQKSA